MLLSKDELTSSAKMHPQVAEFFEKNPQPPASGDPNDPAPIKQIMKTMSEAILAMMGPPPADISESHHEITMRDGFKSSLKIHKPSSGPAGPLVVLIFGGGFIGGDNDQLTPVARVLVSLFGATAVNISYRVGPEYKFPFSQYDSIDSVKWIAENATGSILKADPSQGFVLGGSSAGGCVTAALSRMFQEDKLAHPLTGQWLDIPAIIEKPNCPDEYKEYFISREQNAGAPNLSMESIAMMQKNHQWDINSELRCATASKTRISEQPRTYLQVCGMDPLRDDGLIYEEMLKVAGVPTKIDFYPGCPHGFTAMMRGIEVANKGNIDTIVGFGWLLETPITREHAAKAIGVAPA